MMVLETFPPQQRLASKSIGPTEEPPNAPRSAQVPCSNLFTKGLWFVIHLTSQVIGANFSGRG
jgi:hypothetical protein